MIEGLNDFIKKIMFGSRSSRIIDSRESLTEAARISGFLPFFPNNIRGLSVEEMCAPGMLFGGNYEEGCWEWKGPVIRTRTSAYGKFFKRKAGFVSLNLFPDFLNYRRWKYPVKSGSTEEMLLDIIRENDSLSSTELKSFIFGKRGRVNWDELPESLDWRQPPMKRKSLESPLQRLQMGGWILISDFEYKITKRGERYGWGVARYSTPESVFGEMIKEIGNRTPEESWKSIITEAVNLWPNTSKKQWEILLS